MAATLRQRIEQANEQAELLRPLREARDAIVLLQQFRDAQLLGSLSKVGVVAKDVAGFFHLSPGAGATFKEIDDAKQTAKSLRTELLWQFKPDQLAVDRIPALQRGLAAQAGVSPHVLGTNDAVLGDRIELVYQPQLRLLQGVREEILRELVLRGGDAIPPYLTAQKVAAAYNDRDPSILDGMYERAMRDEAVMVHAPLETPPAAGDGDWPVGRARPMQFRDQRMDGVGLG